MLFLKTISESFFRLAIVVVNLTPLFSRTLKEKNLEGERCGCIYLFSSSNPKFLAEKKEAKQDKVLKKKNAEASITFACAVILWDKEYWRAELPDIPKNCPKFSGKKN